MVAKYNLTSNIKEIEEYLHSIVEDEEFLWVCVGDFANRHNPIIGYGMECPLCSIIEKTNEEIKEFELQIDVAINEIKDLNGEVEYSQDIIESLQKENESLQKSVDTLNEKLLSIYERYPECGI